MFIFSSLIEFVIEFEYYILHVKPPKFTLLVHEENILVLLRYKSNQRTYDFVIIYIDY